MKMNVKNQVEWNEWVNNNRNPYGEKCVRYAESWANLMEDRISRGEELEDVASDTSYEADTECVSGFVYGCAVSMISQCWEHGERFRLWHELEKSRPANVSVNSVEGGRR